MFSGIIEQLGKIERIEHDGSNKILTIAAEMAPELSIDQSIGHDGICLTVTHITGERYSVVAVKETLDVTNLHQKVEGDYINLERCIRLSDRLDGHIVQGHVDTLATCIDVETFDGSWLYTFEYPEEHQTLLVPKGSVTINGVSLTVINPTESTFKVTIIPYTYENTTFRSLEVGHRVNIEFDIIGKYLARHISQSLSLNKN